MVAEFEVALENSLEGCGAGEELHKGPHAPEFMEDIALDLLGQRVARGAPGSSAFVAHASLGAWMAEGGLVSIALVGRRAGAANHKPPRLARRGS